MYLKLIVVYMVIYYTTYGHSFITELPPQQYRENKTLSPSIKRAEVSVRIPENTFLFQQGTGSVGSQTYYYFGQNNENTIIDKMEVQGTVNIDAAAARNLTSNHSSLATRSLNNSSRAFQISNTTFLKPSPQADSQINYTDSQIISQAANVGTENPDSAEMVNNKSGNNYIINLNSESATADNSWQAANKDLETRIENLRDEMRQSIHLLAHEMRVSIAAAISENLQLQNKNKNISEDKDKGEDASSVSSSALEAFFKINGANIIPQVNHNWAKLFDYSFNQYEQKIITSADYLKSLPDFRQFFKILNAVLDGYVVDQQRITSLKIFASKDDVEFLNTNLVKYSEYKDYHA